MQKFIFLTTIPVIGFPKNHERKKLGKGHVMVSMSRKMETVLYVLADGEYTYPVESIYVLILEKIRFECCSSSLPTRIKVVQTYTQSFGHYNHCGKNPC